MYAIRSYYVIKKEDVTESHLTSEEKDQLTHMFESQLPTFASFTVSFENLKDTDDPIVITSYSIHYTKLYETQHFRQFM